MKKNYGQHRIFIKKGLPSARVEILESILAKPMETDTGAWEWLGGCQSGKEKHM